MPYSILAMLAGSAILGVEMWRHQFNVIEAKEDKVVASGGKFLVSIQPINVPADL